MAAEILSAPELWSRTVDRVKDLVNNRPLWETMEMTVGIAIEDDILIIGLNSGIFNQAGRLSVPEHRNAIEKALFELAGRPFAMRLIEGDTLDDWQNTKKSDERVAVMRTATYERKDRAEEIAQSWEGLYEDAARVYSETRLRSLPQNKARYLDVMLAKMVDSLNGLYFDQEDETSERHYARVLDRVAGNAGVPAPFVAREVQRLRSKSKDV